MLKLTCFWTGELIQEMTYHFVLFWYPEIEIVYILQLEKKFYAPLEIGDCLMILTTIEVLNSSINITNANHKCKIYIKRTDTYYFDLRNSIFVDDYKKDLESDLVEKIIEEGGFADAFSS